MVLRLMGGSTPLLLDRRGPMSLCRRGLCKQTNIQLIYVKDVILSYNLLIFEQFLISFFMYQILSSKTTSEKHK